MPITDPEAIKYTNETIRPLCESIRALKARIDSAMVKWNSGSPVFSDKFPVGGGVIEDGREAEGVSRVTGNDAILAIVQFQALQTQLNQAGVAGIIELPCVRPFSAE